MEQNKKNEGARIVQMVANQLADRSAKNPTQPSRGVFIEIGREAPVPITTLMLYMVKMRAVDERQPTAFFSPELSNVEVVNRLISIITGIDEQRINEGNLSDDDWHLVDERVPLLMKAPLYIDDTEKPTVGDLTDKIIRLHRDNGVTLVVIDRFECVAYAEANIKKLAEQLGIVIMAVKE